MNSLEPASIECILCHSKDLVGFSVDGGKLGAKSYFDCNNCRLRFLDPKFHLSFEQEKARYLVHKNNKMDEHYQEFVSPLFNLISDIFTDKVHCLDFGSGESSALSHLLEKDGFTVTQYDPVFHDNKKVLDASYDVVLATEVVEHFLSPHEEFLLLRRLVNVDGYLGMMTQLLDDSIDFKNWYYRRDETHVAFYRRETFDWIASHYGFHSPTVHNENLITLRG